MKASSEADILERLMNERVRDDQKAISDWNLPKIDKIVEEKPIYDIVGSVTKTIALSIADKPLENWHSDRTCFSCIYFLPYLN